MIKWLPPYTKNTLVEGVLTGGVIMLPMVWGHEFVTLFGYTICLSIYIIQVYTINRHAANE